MGGGGDVSIPQRSPGGEWQNIKRFTAGNINQENQYEAGSPYFSVARPYAISNLTNVSELTDPLKTLLSGVPGRFDNLISSQQDVYKGLLPTLDTQGALTPEQERDVTQATRAGFAARGNVTGDQALGSELLNRDIYRQQRFGTALQQGLGLSSSIAGLSGTETGLTTGLTQGIQGLGTQALQNLLGTARAGVQNYEGIQSPIVAWLSDLMSSNQNAAAAQSVAGANKSSGALGGGLGAIGGIASGVGMAL